ncbi:helix-turn-helix transcriptional regulator [Actinocorallia sp. A-T 12471]|uniref:helix-turn-helix transcriptional regulator n=1 Tax=Actinocorallia sp. A-T 12471 TaxID=3089813 RepID=UPI0029D16ABD|nr:WYL domain-containing protein [Actinocorallia sp. A-T 12471]MDX6744269.1 WYL domain-containing protein [Actinocorallia sp. A-T 12471]
MTTTSSDRLSRLLALVPYVVSRDTVSVAEAAEAFGVTERQLRDDLNLLWCLELRSPDPYCPIDLSYEGGDITVAEAESISRPLRLGADEAAALLVALRMLAELPGAAERDALSRVVAKLEAAAGGAAEAARQVSVEVDVRAGALGQVQEALRTGRRLFLSYYVAGRDEHTEREVDPMRVLVVDGRTYLEGWCRRAEAVRLFRMDQITAVRVLEAASSVPAGVRGRDLDGGLYQGTAQDVLATFELTVQGRWVADYYPCESAEEIGEGRLRIVLRASDARWVRSLALRLGDQARLVAPAELVDGVRADAERALALYT